MHEAFSATVLGRHHAIYETCPQCGFLSVRSPHWLTEAYTDAICATDTGIVTRNLAIADALVALCPILSGATGPYLDFGGGTGLLVRLMRDHGFDFRWHDKYADNLLARGFEYEAEMGPCVAVTAFEVLEHVQFPVEFIQDALEFASSDTFIFTTMLFEGDVPAADWWYLASVDGQHISFFRQDTLETIATRLGMRLLTDGWLHVLTRKPISERTYRRCQSRLGKLAKRIANRRRPSLIAQDHKTMVERLLTKSG